jgi:hypothetical protein
MICFIFGSEILEIKPKKSAESRIIFVSLFSIQFKYH